MSGDPRLPAARRRIERAAQSDRGDPEDRAQRGPAASGESELQRAAMIETALQQAISRGEFDNLPGAGKPLPGLGEHRDPDWWIRRKIETEDLRGLGPEAFVLRTESAELEKRLDGFEREADVRDALEAFNRRVVEARRQLQGGPPVVTPTRDVAAEVAAWRERRERRRAAERTPPPDHRAGRRRRRRRGFGTG